MLRKVEHSNPLFLSISFAFPCRPIGALVRFPCGGGVHQLQFKFESAKCSEKQQSPYEGEWRGGLKFKNKMLEKNNQAHT